MEKYGVIPKKFTKAWWEYFWEYYKIHTIGTVLLIMIIGVPTYQMITKTDYDSIITYIGVADYEEKTIEEISSKISTIAEDINSDGNTEILFQPIVNLNNTASIENPQYTMAFEVKKLAEIQKGKGFLFIFDSEQTAMIYENDIADNLFIPADEWLETDGYKKAEGEAEKFFIKIPGNNILKELGFITDEIYIGIRKIRENDKDDNLNAQNEAIKIAKYILNSK